MLTLRKKVKRFLISGRNFLKIKKQKKREYKIFDEKNKKKDRDLKNKLIKGKRSKNHQIFFKSIGGMKIYLIYHLVLAIIKNPILRIRLFLVIDQKVQKIICDYLRSIVYSVGYLLIIRMLHYYYNI